jgi:hypothetical protein
MNVMMSNSTIETIGTSVVSPSSNDPQSERDRAFDQKLKALELEKDHQVSITVSPDGFVCYVYVVYMYLT